MRLSVFPAISAGLSALIILSAGPTGASCLAQPEDGDRRNVDRTTRSITRAKLRFARQDQVLNGRPYPPGPPWYVQPSGACKPRDCDRGEIGARRDNGWIFGRIDQRAAKREVRAKISGGRLRVYIRTEFIDLARSGYNSDGFFASR